jgi:hypothetical protein
VNENNHNINQFNKTVVSVAVRDTKYILDASDKHNTYTDIPFDILNSLGLFIDPVGHLYILSHLKNEIPSRKIIFVNAEIKAEGEIIGTAQVNNF